jgi:hypothetical protein
MSSYCRQFPRDKNKEIHTDISEVVVGTKGQRRFEQTRHATELENPYVREHAAMVASIRGDGPHINHAMAVAESTMTCIMARESAYSGQRITWDMIMNSKQDLQPKAFDYDLKMEVPPLPVPGEYKFV